MLKVRVGQAKILGMRLRKVAEKYKDGVVYTELSYEGYGPAGVAIMVECLSDNKNRTVAAVRTTFGKTGGNMGENGSVAWQFDKKGVIKFLLDLIRLDRN